MSLSRLLFETLFRQIMVEYENLGENKCVGLFVGVFFRAFKSSRKVMFLTERFGILISE